MSTQGQGDVVAQLRGLSRHPRYHGVTWTSSEAAICGAAADEIDRLRTLLSSSRGEQGWRTIDSAPKDGTPILIEAMLSQGLVVVEVRYDAGAQIRGRHGAFVWAPTDGGDIIAEGVARRWMPLPSAPITTEGGGE